ncbi:Glutathione transport system permease protein GsiD [subsurface metagenome]
MADSSSNRVAERKRHSFLVDFFIRLVKEKPLGTVSGALTLLLLLVGIFAGFLAPYGMNEPFPADRLLAPSAKYWLGTDNIGRDLLSRVIYGARISVIVGLAGSFMATSISTIIGIVFGYLGGKADLIAQRLVDAVMCFPGLVLLLVVMSMVGPGMVQIIIVIGISWGIWGSRVIRGATIAAKENVYVTAAVALGCSPIRIIIRHILPNVMAPVIILLTTRVPGVILTEASLSFLGLGIPPPAPSWGGMLGGAGRDNMLRAPWMAIWPGLALATVVYSINMFGDAVRDLLDPRLRGGVGRYGVRKVKRVSQKEK